MSVNQAPHHAPDEPVARVLALVEGEGYSVPAAAELVGVNPNTAQKWVQQAREVTQGNKPILDRWHRRVSKSLDLMQRGLDYIDEDESNQLAFKSLQTLNIIAGTGTDKLQRDKELSQPKESTQVLIVLNCTAPQDAIDQARDYADAQAIEGEARPAPEAAP